MDMTITLCFSVVLLGNSVALAHDASTEASTIPSNKVPPLLFPEDDSQYRIITQNETAIQHILAITSKDDVIRNIPLTEGQSSTAELKTTVQTEKVETSPLTPTRAIQEKDSSSEVDSDEAKDEDDANYYEDTTDDPKEEVEKIQSDGKYKTDEELEEQFNRNSDNEEKQKSQEIVDIVVDYSAEMDHTHIVAIIAVVTIAILAFAAYFGLIYWRYHLQKIYGSRQRLVTEDDWYHNDSRDFEI
ncbi:uncharacterized protein LOC132259030 isoform X2 [Phlebotomus argentipes]|uniref:uncharacterized protein LOC132259030 isoform X2 n=1 Tax=Phlebotomus argentipes TaxID=94469 RepID=UPI002893834C|nr:uncharacterized protein LOC132259030 isoform X2 [Phlebotomus argentipes]